MIERLHKVLLALAPRRFRERFGHEMLETARALDAERPRSARRVARAALDAVLTPLAVRAESRQELRRRTPVQPGSDLMESWFRDLRFAGRGLRRDPRFTLFVLIALALGIGANAATMSMVDRLLVSGPAHVRDADRLARVYATARSPSGEERTSDSFGHVAAVALQATRDTVEGVATYSVDDGILDRGADSRRIRIGYADAGLFPLLGTTPARGRFFTTEENSVRGATRVVVLGHELWTDRFAGDLDVVGRSVLLDNEAYTVIGVARAGFTGPQFSRVDAWIPINVLSPTITADFETSWRAQWLRIVARLRPGIAREDAGPRLTAALHLAHEGADEDTLATARLWLAPLQADGSGAELTEVRVLRWLTGITVIVLLVACANVANLMLARASRLGHDAAVRAALGAGRGRLVRMRLLESLLLAAGGGLLGLAVAALVTTVVRRNLFTVVEWSGPIVDGRVFVATAIIVVVVGLVTGVVPAWRASQTSVTGALRGGVRDGAGRRARLRNALTAAQAALSVVLLVGAGLFVRSLWNVESLDLGVEASAVLVASTDRPAVGSVPAGPERDAERERRRRFLPEHLAAIQSLPGVETASVAIGMPFGYGFGVPLRAPEWETIPRLPSGGPSISAVTPDYFRTIGTDIVRGRSFAASAGTGSEPEVVVSATMASTVWPDADPIGRCLYIGEASTTCARVVGVAEDARRSRLREERVMHYYVPAGQESGFGGAVLLVRPSGGRDDVTSAVRRFLNEADPAISYVSVEWLQDRIDPQIRPWRQALSVFLVSGLLVLVVAGIGMYSVVAYLVADRRHEIGVRIALGASPWQVARLVLRSSLATATAGVVVGLGLAALASPLVAPLLFETPARDPVVYAAIAALLLAVSILATVSPAWRARRIDGAEILGGSSAAGRLRG